MLKNNNEKKIATMIKKVALKTADYSCGSASGWSMYQPKEPKRPANLKK